MASYSVKDVVNLVKRCKTLGKMKKVKVDIILPQETKPTVGCVRTTVDKKVRKVTGVMGICDLESSIQQPEIVLVAPHCTNDGLGLIIFYVQ